MRLVGDYEVDVDAPKRGYTTRAKEEQRRTAAPAFTGRVRRWEKRWTQNGHLTVLRWERVDEGDLSNGGGPSTEVGLATAGAMPAEEPSRKRARSQLNS
eukprot:CAMPEP_0174705450 /NCGR_PEP_ID=MMETSP1094-20130205/8671_1 /TAXON_ID=156173 /ORGANISM="Chrysochromulina brevifilum, Strain UTEX LB 985" /LENGTH=98 /DNA_ID=CAMNT_0015903615 /DNA_START=21 /DNA_END=317 /DNA_ORIENTATION=+